MNDDVHLFSKDCPSAETAAREAQRLNDLRGPGIVALQGRGQNGELLLAKAACSLADVLHERGSLPDEEVRAVGAAAAAALARVHEAGLVHGDVKPANLLLSRDGELWLADFDAACPSDGRPLERFSPGRLPPGAPALPAADVAALGLALVELSTGAVLDPGADWQAADLRRLGCSPALCADVSFMLGGGRATLSAPDAAEMLGRGGYGPLPAPASEAQRVDPTPTVEFMPPRHPRPELSPPSGPAPPGRPPRWWQRLAESWRPTGSTLMSAVPCRGRAVAGTDAGNSRSAELGRGPSGP